MKALATHHDEQPPSPPSQSETPPTSFGTEPVGRPKVCPFLLRTFIKRGSHHNAKKFAMRGSEPKNELQIYTWKDATLRELTDLVKEVTPEARNAALSFALVYPTRVGRFTMRKVGMTFSSRKREDDVKTLDEVKFQVGDYLDVAII